MFTGESKAETLLTFNTQASKGQLEMNFDVGAKQSWTALSVLLVDVPFQP